MRTRLAAILPLPVFSVILGACSASADAAHELAPVPIAAVPNPLGRSVDLDLAENTPERDPSEATAFFVWMRESDDRTVTYRVDADGQVRETLDGIVLATAIGAWQWLDETMPVPTVPCERYDDEGHELEAEAAETGTATRGWLRHVASGAEQVIVDPGDDLAGNNEIQHAARVIASIGPYLFIEQSIYVDSCGAHGNTDVSSMIWNASAGGPAAPQLDLESLRAHRAAAVRELANDEEDVVPITEDNVELTELVPRFSTDGVLTLGVQFTVPTCYACTRGGWGSYTKSIVVDSGGLPAVLAPFAEPPPAVRAFLRSHREAALGGWSAR